MGEIADAILIGRICQQCLQPFAVDQGYPQDCLRCRAANAPDLRLSCPVCQKRVKPGGLPQHVRSKHGNT